MDVVPALRMLLFTRGPMLQNTSRWTRVVVAVSLAACAEPATEQRQSIIFGEDDRREVYEVTNPTVHALATESVIESFRSVMLDETDAAEPRVRTNSRLGEYHGLCPGA